MHAQTAAAASWWAKPRGETNAAWIANYQNSLNSRHRTVLVETVRGLEGVTSVLEVGSHCGPNLVRLAKDLPGLTQLTGVDVNAEAVAAGQGWMHRLGLDERVQLVQGRIPDATQSLASGCVDVVLSCYALAYIAPADLDGVLYEMGRLARRAVILAEPMSGGIPRPPSLSDYQEWAHDYQSASKWLATWRGTRIGFVPVSPPVDRLERVLVAVRQ